MAHSSLGCNLLVARSSLGCRQLSTASFCMEFRIILFSLVFSFLKICCECFMNASRSNLITCYSKLYCNKSMKPDCTSFFGINLRLTQNCLYEIVLLLLSATNKSNKFSSCLQSSSLFDFETTLATGSFIRLVVFCDFIFETLDTLFDMDYYYNLLN